MALSIWPFQKAAPNRGSADGPKQPDVFYLNNGVGVAVVTWSDSIAAQQAMSHPIVYRALHKLASSVQQVKWFAEIDPDTATEDQAGKVAIIRKLNAVLNSPNDDMTPEMLRYWLALNYAVYGRAPLRVTHGALDPTVANGIYTLETKQMVAHYNQRGSVTKYDYGMGETKESYPSFLTWKNERLTKGFADMIWRPGLKGYQHRTDYNTPMHSLGLPAQVIRSLLVRAINTAEGHPNVRYLVTCSKTLQEEQKKALKRYLNEDHGPDGPESGKVPILQNAADVVIHKLDNDLSDIHSKMPSDDMARLIFGAFGIPIALAGMGAADGAKFAGNFIESRASFWQDTVVPDYVSPIFKGLTRVLCPIGVRISPDLDSIPAMVDGRVSSMSKASAVNFLTTDEKRELFGWAATTLIPQVQGATTTPAAAPTTENPPNE
jgi:hypothetical protein